MNEIRDMFDELGPRKVLIVREPAVGLEAFVVVDNIAAGPAIGGVRMAADVTMREVARLARAMTLKNSAAGLPHGGGKSGIVSPHDIEPARKERLIRAFARAIGDLTEYIPGPDMGTNEECMAWVQDETGRSVGLPRVIGGIPLDEIGATAYGVAAAADVAAPWIGLDLDGACVAIEGFGAVGRHAARFLAERGTRLVAASDSGGGVTNTGGLDLDALIAHKAGGQSVAKFSGGQPITTEELIACDCDIWIPAARPDVFTGENIGTLKAKLIIQGANIPATEEAERWMHENGVLCIPDFIANAGGVICASVEYDAGTQAQALTTIEEKVGANTREMLERARDGGMMPRAAAEEMALARLREAMGYRRF